MATVAYISKLLNLLVPLVPEPVVIKDKNGIVIAANVLGEALLQQRAADEVAVLAGSKPTRPLAPSNSSSQIQFASTPLIDEKGNHHGELMIAHDHSGRTQKSHDLRKFSYATEQSPTAIVIANIDGRVEYANAAYYAMSGLIKNTLDGQQHPLLQPSAENAPYFGIWQALARDTSWTGVISTPRPDGTLWHSTLTALPIVDDFGKTTHYLTLQQDITERIDAETKLIFLTYFDSLTGLPNRDYLHNKLKSILDDPPDGSHHGLLVLDIDRFALLHDAEGAAFSDDVLKATAQLLATSEPGIIATRIGSDEFAMLMPNIAHTAAGAALRIQNYCTHLYHLLECKISTATHVIPISVSIGATIFYSGCGLTPEHIVQHASTALHRAQHEGSGRPTLFDSAMEHTAHRRFLVEQELRFGISASELRLYLQPQVNSLGETVGAEVLVRWQHPTRGLLPPREFIPIAEDSTLIVDLERWILTHALAWLRNVRNTTAPERISINISPRHFALPDFTLHVREQIEGAGVDPRRVTLEITESVVADNIELVIAKMHELRRIGLHFSIDDFGTGYSSLAYLKRLPIQEVKIDKAFVQDAPNDPSDAALVRAIIAVADALSLQVVAEGVETLEHASFLKNYPSIIHQGYLYGRPTPANDWFHYIRK